MPKLLVLVVLTLSPAAFAYEELTTIEIRSDDIQLKNHSLFTDSQVEDKEQIEQKQAAQVSEVIKDIPGVSVSSGPRLQAEAPKIRGLDSRRILILIDGAKQNLRTQHNGGTFIDPAFLKKVDVLSGPSASIYGSGAIGGVISFNTLNASDLLRPGEKVGAQVGLSSLRQESLSQPQAFHYHLLGYGEYGRYDVLGGVSSKSSDNLRLSNDRELAYSAYESESALFKIKSHLPKNRSFSFLFDSYNSESFTPLDPSATIDDPLFLGDDKRERQSLVVNTTSNRNTKFGQYNLNFTRSNTKLTKSRQSDQREDVRTILTNSFDFHQFVKVINSQSHVIYGLEYLQDRNQGSRNDGPLPSFPSGRADYYGGFAQLKYNQGNWSLMPGVRFDRFNMLSEDNDSLDYSDSEVGSRLGVAYNFSPSQVLSLNYAEGFNPPRIQDLFVEGQHFPDNGFFPANYFVPNPDLKSERSQSYELSYKQATENLLLSDDFVQFKTAVFSTKVDNYIYQDIDLIDGTTQFINLPGVNLRGYELSSLYMLGPMSFEPGYSEVYSWDVFNAQPVSDTPANQFSLNVSYKSQGKNRFYIGGIGRWVRYQDRTNQQDLIDFQKTSNYNVFDLYTGLQFQSFGDTMSQLQLRANNILDKTYRVHGQIMEAPARNFRLSYKTNF